jgi:hypothetical protein
MQSLPAGVVRPMAKMSAQTVSVSHEVAMEAYALPNPRVRTEDGPR